MNMGTGYLFGITGITYQTEFQTVTKHIFNILNKQVTITRLWRKNVFEESPLILNKLIRNKIVKAARWQNP